MMASTKRCRCGAQVIVGCVRPLIIECDRCKADKERVAQIVEQRRREEHTMPMMLRAMFDVKLVVFEDNRYGPWMGHATVGDQRIAETCGRATEADAYASLREQVLALASEDQKSS